MKKTFLQQRLISISQLSWYGTLATVKNFKFKQSGKAFSVEMWSKLIKIRFVSLKEQWRVEQSAARRHLFLALWIFFKALQVFKSKLNHVVVVITNIWTVFKKKFFQLSDSPRKSLLYRWFYNSYTVYHLFFLKYGKRNHEILITHYVAINRVTTKDTLFYSFRQFHKTKRGVYSTMFWRQKSSLYGAIEEVRFIR